MSKRYILRVLAVQLCVVSSAVFAQTPLASRLSQAPQDGGQSMPPSWRYALRRAPQANLGPIDRKLMDVPVNRPGVFRIAAHRPLSSASFDLGRWQTTTDGSGVWQLSVRSTGAAGVRVHFTNFAVGNGRVWIHDDAHPSKELFGPYIGRGPNGKGDFWSEVILSDTAEIEYEAPAGGVPGRRPPFEIAEVTHLWQLKMGGFTGSPAADAQSSGNQQCYISSGCSIDFDASVIDTAIRASALILYEDGSSTYQCSATLLNAANKAPLLLTAGHCINNNEQAQSLIALFALTEGCAHAPFPTITSDTLLEPYQVRGVRLLSYVNRPFLAEIDVELHNALDYSLVLLDGFPPYDRLLESGYSSGPIKSGTELVSVSNPMGMYYKLALSTVIPSFWDNGFEVDQSSEGRVAPGSSGSGVFDSDKRLVGILSTAETPCPNSDTCHLTTCDVQGGFKAIYTSFASVYPMIRGYMEAPLDSSGNTVPSDPNVFSATPLANVNFAGYGDTTLTINAGADVSLVEIHVGSPDGPLLYMGGRSGSVTASRWVTDAMAFYLQDISDNQPRTLANTIATAVVHKGRGVLVAEPPEMINTDVFGYGSMNLIWSVPGATASELHAGSSDGPLVAYEGQNGWAHAEGWVSEGMQFVLCDVSAGPCSARNTVATLIAHGPSATVDVDTGQRSFSALPNPIPVVDGQTYASAVLVWRESGLTGLELHAGSLDGPLVAIGDSFGSVKTGPWVTDGMTFYLRWRGVLIDSTRVTFAKTDTAGSK